MLLSMTGFGDAGGQLETVRIAVEVRSVNNRYFKLAARLPEAYASLESRIEKLVRQSIARGTVTLSVRIERGSGSQPYTFEQSVLEGYWKDLSRIALSLGTSPPANLGPLLDLPGVVTDAERNRLNPTTDWPRIESTVGEALARLQEFRVQEGKAMEADLRVSCREIADSLEQVAVHAPQVVAEYRDKLFNRVRELLSATEARVEPNDLIREVSIFADRCDINEEITRLRSHFEQFDTFLAEPTSQGRKLEFLSQEMFREINTIGSKANNVKIAHAAVVMKSAVEKMREILQNVE